MSDSMLTGKELKKLLYLTKTIGGLHHHVDSIDIQFTENGVHILLRRGGNPLSIFRGKTLEEAHERLKEYISRNLRISENKLEEELKFVRKNIKILQEEEDITLGE